MSAPAGDDPIKAALEVAAQMARDNWRDRNELRGFTLEWPPRRPP